MSMWLSFSFLITAGLVLLPLAVLAYLVFSTMSQDHSG